MFLTPQQETEIYPILDKALDLAPGKGVLHRCAVTRADYLSRMVHGLRYDSAIESIQIYTPDSPLYGQGLYATLWAEPHEQGLLVTKLEQPHYTLMWKLIMVAAFHEPQTFEETYNHVRQRLVRAQRKHPEVMNFLWVDSGPPVTAYYATRTAEELLIVDIDTNPEGPLAAPTKEERAKSGRPMDNPDTNKE